MKSAYLRAWRAYQGWTQQQLADALGISVSRIIDYERGTTRGRETPAKIPRYIALALVALERMTEEERRRWLAPRE
jgi:transcriptional regulator with XRE-family HTH domain